MSANVYDTERHIYPRWRSFQATASLGEVARPATGRDVDTDALDESLAQGIADWEANPSLWFGLDLLGTAIVSGRIQEFSALIAKVREDPLIPRGAHDLLSNLYKPADTKLELPECQAKRKPDVGREIREGRRRVSLAPRDAIEWVDLALAFTIAGQTEKALRAILAALQLAPANRFVLRSAARFFLHEGDKERALSVLAKSDIIRIDPWVMASEIAIADSIGQRSKCVKLARDKMDAGKPPGDLTELSAALGTLEAENGNHRISRKFLRKALVGANENSIAQISWLNRHHLAETVDISHANPPLLHEACAWASYYEHDFGTAQNEALCWLRDQPFASAPATLASYIAADINMDFESGVEIARSGARANPDDPGILNNLAYCLLELGRIPEAESALARAKSDPNKPGLEPALKATGGLLAFRKGDVAEGRRLYLEAIDKAKVLGSRSTAARAAYHLAYEELLANSPSADDAIGRMKEFKDQQKIAELAGFFGRVTALLKGRGRDPTPCSRNEP